MQITIIQMAVSVLLFFVLFFGIGFILHMVLRMTWLMAALYPIVVIFIIDQVKWYEYFTKPGESLGRLWERILSLHAADVIILLSGFAGAVLSGIAIRILRQKGYQMF